MRTTPTIVALALTPALVFAADRSASVGVRDSSIALGKPYTFSKPPSYPKCRGPSDKTELTDGKYTESTAGAFWVTQSTVGWGWLHSRHVSITIDLGKVEPIQGLSYSTAGGWGGVAWPIMIDVQVSDDGKDFFSAGDLVDLTQGDIPDPAARWTVRKFRYETSALRTKGRYVRLVIVPSSRFVFCDEIEVYRGPDTFLNLAPGERTEERISAERMVRLGCKYRLRLDLQQVRSAIESAPMLDEMRRAALKHTDDLAHRIQDSGLPQDPATFRAVVPFDELHCEMLRLHAQVLASHGVPELLVWQSEKYAPMALFDRPSGTGARLDVRMMRNEYRPAAFNVTNASPRAKRLALEIKGLPGGRDPGYVVPHQVEFVDTRDAVVVASALVPLPKEHGSHTLHVPAGMTRQVWLLFHPEEIAAGDYRGEIVLTGQDVTERVPIRLSIADLRFPDEIDLFFSMWDYAFEENPYISRELTPRNRAAAVRDMQAHFVNVPVSMKMPWPKPGAFDAKGELVGKIDYSAFDRWVEAWPNAKCYAIFARVWPHSPTMGGIARGQDAFPRAVCQWAADWARHNRELGLRPGQVGVLFVDEPHTEEHYQRTREWAEPFRAGTRDIRVLTTATLSVKRDDRQIAALRRCDTIWTKRWAFTNNTDEYWSIYRDFQQQGHDVWFYMCEGPVRHFDPAYYRLQPWQCLRAGATGSAFWSYCDAGGERSWCPYGAWRKKNNFSPVYIGPDSVTASKHWEAAREGVEDHQYLLMLGRAANDLKQRGVNTALVREASQLAESLPDDVVKRLDRRAILIAHKEWTDKAPSHVAEQARLRALDMLVKLDQLAR